MLEKWPVRSAARALALGALLLGSSGCVMGPDYKRPDMPQPQQFRSSLTPQEATSLADLAWWDVFGDRQLRTLISQGLTHNYDLQIAISRIEQARATVGIVRSQGLPQVGYGAVAERQKTVTPGVLGDVSSGSASGTLSAAWELDMWGRIRRQTESARANFYAQEEIRRGVMLSLVSEIADGYFRLLQLDRQLAIARESQATFRKTHELFDLRYRAGRDSLLPVERAKSALDASTALISDLQREITQRENALSILTGSYPGPISRGTPLTAQVMPATPVGLTTDLIRRRPDIREAEQAMIGANAEIGAAIASFYPSISLSALLGIIGINTDVGGTRNVSFGRGGADLLGPIFQGGRLRSIYRERQAFWDETVANYRKTIITAFKETSDALIAQQTLAARRAALETQIVALRSSVDLANMRYLAGRASYFEILEAQQQLFPAEDELAQVQEAQLTAVVSLYKALGGGWKLTDAQWSEPVAVEPTDADARLNGWKANTPER